MIHTTRSNYSFYKLFNLFRISDWRGSYPRPLVEPFEKTWKAKDGNGIYIDGDK